jgi:hypothetical protein
VRSAGFQDPPEVGEAKSWLGPQDSNLALGGTQPQRCLTRTMNAGALVRRRPRQQI